MNQPIQCTISGFLGKACTLFSMLNTDTGVLVIAVEAEYRTERRNGTVVISNEEIARDVPFTEKDILPAIRAFYALKTGIAADGKSNRLVFGERGQRANPDSAVEHDGVDSAGVKYRVSDTITNLQVACLATCLHATKASKIEQALSMMDEFDPSRGKINIEFITV